jgi:hypothetical protein
VLTGIEQLTRVIELEDIYCIQKVLFVIFELPSDKYYAFRFISTEIIENLSYLLCEKRSDGQYMLEEAQKFISYVTDGLKIKQTEMVSSRCFIQLCQQTKAFMHPFTEEIIRNVLPEKLDDWKANDCHANIIGSLGVLTCQIGEENPEKCTENLNLVLSYITQPLVNNIDWIKNE